MARFLLRYIFLLVLSICAAPQQVSVTGSMSDGRFYHTSTLLADGRVLVTGGWDNSTALSTAEIYDPSTQTFALTGSMSTPRVLHTATRLGNGKVL
jgi:Kelch motif